MMSVDQNDPKYSLTLATRDDIERKGEPVGKHQAQIMIINAVTDAKKQFELDHSNVAAEKLELEVRLRKQMEELITPIIEL